jgi:hypothetical protein
VLSSGRQYFYRASIPDGILCDDRLPRTFRYYDRAVNPDGLLKEIRHLEQYIWAGFLSEWGDLGQKQIEVIQTDNLNSKTDS